MWLVQCEAFVSAVCISAGIHYYRIRIANIYIYIIYFYYNDLTYKGLSNLYLESCCPDPDPVTARRKSGLCFLFVFL